MFTKTMNILELFAGSRSLGNIADEQGHKVFSIDINNYEKINLVKDIEYLQKQDLPFTPDVIWASPPCTSYSIAGITHHRKNGIAISDFAIKSDRLVKKTLEIISWYPESKYFIENPVGLLRKSIIMRNLPRATICYCKYGHSCMKPTDIWSNHLYSFFNLDGWQPRKMCFNNNKNCHHIASPRGSNLGTSGLSNAYERSRIPKELMLDILNSVNVGRDEIRLEQPSMFA